MRPFEGIKIVDVTHVLAGPFAAYQLAVLGADVIKVEDPNDCDQSRYHGSADELNKTLMGTGYLSQGSNKRCITLNLKTVQGRDILKRLAAEADVFVENYRSGAFKVLGLGYDDLKQLNPRLIYCSMTAFGQDGPRGEQTAYDHAIQAISGLMASTGTAKTAPMKCGAPIVDYGTGTMAAFAIASALFQRERTGRGQHIDCSMLDAALMLQASHITNHLVTHNPTPLKGNWHTYAGTSLYDLSGRAHRGFQVLDGAAERCEGVPQLVGHPCCHLPEGGHPLLETDLLLERLNFGQVLKDDDRSELGAAPVLQVRHRETQEDAPAVRAVPPALETEAPLREELEARPVEEPTLETEDRFHAPPLDLLCGEPEDLGAAAVQEIHPPVEIGRQETAVDRLDDVLVQGL